MAASGTISLSARSVLGARTANGTISLSTCSVLEARTAYLQTVRTEGYTLHNQLFLRVYTIRDLINFIDNTLAWFSQQGLEVPPSQNKVNAMQKLFMDAMGLFEVAQSFITLYLVPGFEQWDALNTLRSRVELYVHRNDWRQLAREWVETEKWRDIANDVFEYGSDMLRDVAEVVFRVDSITAYEGIAIGVGSIWGTP